jgi:hypothetical protein
LKIHFFFAFFEIILKNSVNIGRRQCFSSDGERWRLMIFCFLKVFLIKFNFFFIFFLVLN